MAANGFSYVISALKQMLLGRKKDFSKDEILVAELLSAATRGGGAKGILAEILSYV